MSVKLLKSLKKCIFYAVLSDLVGVKAGKLRGEKCEKNVRINSVLKRVCGMFKKCEKLSTAIHKYFTQFSEIFLIISLIMPLKDVSVSMRFSTFCNAYTTVE